MAVPGSPSQPKPEASLQPLLTWVETIHREVHQNPSDEEVARIIEENYSRSLLFDEDSTLKDFDAFKAFNTAFRETYVAIEITDSKPVVFKQDPEGKAGVVGFATSWVFERKQDKEQVGGDTIEIFEATWNPDVSVALGGRRMITRAFVAFGDPTPVT